MPCIFPELFSIENLHGRVGMTSLRVANARLISRHYPIVGLANSSSVRMEGLKVAVGGGAISHAPCLVYMRESLVSEIYRAHKSDFTTHLEGGGHRRRENKRIHGPGPRRLSPRLRVWCFCFAAQGA